MPQQYRFGDVGQPSVHGRTFVLCHGTNAIRHIEPIERRGEILEMRIDGSRGGGVRLQEPAFAGAHKAAKSGLQIELNVKRLRARALRRPLEALILKEPVQPPCQERERRNEKINAAKSAIDR